MLQLFNLIKKLLRMFMDVAFMSQIILMVIIFAFVMYWFFDVINCQYLAFLTPVANNISGFMHQYFADSLSKGATKTDGSLFIFIMILLITIGALTQLKSFAITASKKIVRIIDKIKIKNEDEFNAQLRAEADQAILAYRNVILITKLLNNIILYITEQLSYNLPLPLVLDLLSLNNNDWNLRDDSGVFLQNSSGGFQSSLKSLSTTSKSSSATVFPITHTQADTATSLAEKGSPSETVHSFTSKYISLPDSTRCGLQFLFP